MRRFVLPAAMLLSTLLFSSCEKKEAAANAPHATVYMRDGSSYTGSVVSSSPSQLTIAADDKTTRTLDMRNVKSVEYDDAAAPLPAATAQAPAPQGQLAPPTRAQDDYDRVHERHLHPEESAIRSRTYNLPVGTRLSVRTEETIDSARASEGQTYAGEITRDVTDPDGAVVIPRGSNAQIIIRSASKGGRFKGTSDLVLDMLSVSVDGRQYQLETANIVKRGKDGMGANRRTAEYTGGGAAIGAIIGAIAGHGKGAAIGAASGAAAGVATQAVTKGGSIRVPAETVLTFQLDQPLHVTARI